MRFVYGDIAYQANHIGRSLFKPTSIVELHQERHSSSREQQEHQEQYLEEQHIGRRRASKGEEHREKNRTGRRTSPGREHHRKNTTKNEGIASRTGMGPKERTGSRTATQLLSCTELFGTYCTSSDYQPPRKRLDEWRMWLLLVGCTYPFYLTIPQSGFKELPESDSFEI